MAKTESGQDRAIISAIAWPVLVGGAALGVATMTVTGTLSGLGLTLLAVAQLLLATLFEWLVPHRADWKFQNDKRIPNDLGHVLMTALLGDRLGGLLFAGVTAGLAATILPEGAFGVWPMAWPLWGQVILAILVIEVLDYWRHRLDHQVNWLWPLHLVHHTPETMNAIKSARNHFSDIVFRHVLAYIPVLLLGAPAEAIVWHAAAVALLGIPGHANIAYRLPAWMDHWVMTPAYHRVYHSCHLPWGNSNYTNLFPLIDKVFGSFSNPVDMQKAVGDDVGVEFNPVPKDFLSECLTPILWFTRQGSPKA